MDCIKGISKYYQTHLIKKNLEKGKIGGPVEFENARNIIILYDAGDSDFAGSIRKYAEKLIKSGRKVSKVGFSDVKLKSDDQRHQDIIYRNDINYFTGKPSAGIVRYYAHQQYDFLIYLSLQEYFPLNYLAAVCPAKFKTGNYSPSRTKILDFMLNTNESSSDRIIDQLDQFLSQIHKN